ncbi:MAG: DUF2892 domain-containing protein [Candidatus Omnitrophica bacterium]|nr:DUF2892 domain-containing protein [Candidatus Omnitrophota bacterium]
MTANMGKTDRLVRSVAGVMIISAGIFYRNWLGLLGLIPLVTAVVRFCPFYTLLKISTSTAGAGKKAKMGSIN